MKEFTFNLNEEAIKIIGFALMEVNMPYKVVHPLIEDINKQIASQLQVSEPEA